MVKTTRSARSMIFKVLETLPENEKERFGRDLRKRFDEIITGEIPRVFEIMAGDVVMIVRDGGYTIPKSLI